MRVRIADVVFVCAAFAAPAYADVTFKMKVSGSGPDSASAGERTDYITGNKLRMDLSVAGDQRSVIVDLGTHQLIFLEPRERMASIVGMRPLAAEMPKDVPAALTASVAVTSRTREIAGATGAMAEVMKQMGGMGDAQTTTTEVVSVSTATIPPSTFEVPAGYEVVK